MASPQATAVAARVHATERCGSTGWCARRRHRPRGPAVLALGGFVLVLLMQACLFTTQAITIVWLCCCLINRLSLCVSLMISHSVRPCTPCTWETSSSRRVWGLVSQRCILRSTVIVGSFTTGQQQHQQRISHIRDGRGRIPIVHRRRRHVASCGASPTTSLPDTYHGTYLP